MNLESITKTIQVISVVAGVVISVLSFNATREKEAEARRVEASKPFLTLRQTLYMEAVKIAAVLATPEVHTPEALSTARRRFRELYVAELSMVESPEVASQMVALARKIDPHLLDLNDAELAAYNLARALGNSFVSSWSGTGK